MAEARCDPEESLLEAQSLIHYAIPSFSVFALVPPLLFCWHSDSHASPADYGLKAPHAFKSVLPVNLDSQPAAPKF